MTLASTLAQIERTQTAAGRQQSGRFSAEGLRLNERAVRAGILPEAAVCAQRLLDAPTPREAALLSSLREADAPLFPLSNDQMVRLVNGRGYGDLIGLYRLPKPPALADIAAAPCTLLVTVDVRDPGNLGALCRTAHALGAAALITIGGSDPFAPKTVRTSMGSLFKLPIVPYETVAPFLAACAALNIETVGTVSAGGQSPTDAVKETASKTAVLLGSEYHGLPDSLLPQLNTLVTIPMTPGVDSLSVNAAAAILLFALRQN